MEVRKLRMWDPADMRRYDQEGIMGLDVVCKGSRREIVDYLTRITAIYNLKFKANTMIYGGYWTDGEDAYLVT